MQRTLVFLLLVLLPRAALADGKVFATAIGAHLTIPDQRALIHFTNRTERLVVETRFSGSGTNFAWVVPLPSQPIIEEASTGLFPTLQHLFQPQIVHDAPRYFLGIFALVGIGYLVIFVRPTKPLNWLDVIACLLIWSGASSVNPFFAFVVFVLLLIGLLLVRFAKGSALVVFVYPKLGLGVGAGSIALACAVYFALPRIEVRLVKYPGVEAWIKLDDLCIWLESHDSTTLAELRKEADRALANPTNDVEWQRFSPNRHWHYQDSDNLLVGGRIHEEDSPGNYTFREVGDLVRFVGYDVEGAEDVLGEWPLRQGR